MLRKISAVCLTATLVSAAVAVGSPARSAPATTTSAPSTSVPAAAGAYCRTPVDYTRSIDRTALVRRIDVGNHENEAVRYDRVVIRLSAPALSYQVRYVPQLYADGSGDPVELRGSADIEVKLDATHAHEDGQSTVPVRNHVRNWRSLRQVKLFSDFEATVLVGIGVNRRTDFRVFTLTGPDRLVIDLAMPGEHPWTCSSGAVRVYFLNEPRFVANTPPFFTPVWRRVRTPAVAGGALHSLFHGPLMTEHDQGLRLVSSDATGFRNLSISNGIARVRLTGGCDSHGSTVTVAGSIIATLKQFPHVRYVKIQDPSGNTGNPTGNSDSIPDCLNP